MTAVMKKPVNIESLLYPKISKTLLDPTRRHDVLFLFDIENGNPNGDPDAENAPRTENNGYGLVTDGCTKSKMRRVFSEYGEAENFIQPTIPLNNHIRDAVVAKGGALAEVMLPGEDDDSSLAELIPDLLVHLENQDDITVEGRKITYTGAQANKAAIESALKGDLPSNSPLLKLIRDLKLPTLLETALSGKKSGIPEEVRQNAEKEMVRRFMDVRMFGAVMSTGLNAGQRRGPVQVSMPSSIDPIFPQEIAITRQAKTTAERPEKSKTEIGRRSMVSYALYRGHMFYNAPLGILNGVTEADMELLWQSMVRMFSLDHAAGRAMMRMRGLYVWSHKTRYGEAPFDRLFETIKITNTGPQYPRSFADYEVEVPEFPDNDHITFTRLIG